MKLKPQNLTELIADSQSIIAGKITRVTDGIAPNGTLTNDSTTGACSRV